MYSMSVKMFYEKEHLIWAAYMLLGDNEHLKNCHFPSGLSKKIIRDYLRSGMSQFGADGFSLFGSNYVESDGVGEIDTERKNKAIEWVNSRDWDK